MSVTREIFYIALIVALAGVLSFVFFAGSDHNQVKHDASMTKGYNYALKMEVKKDAIQTRNTGNSYLIKRLRSATFLP